MKLKSPIKKLIRIISMVSALSITSISFANSTQPGTIFYHEAGQGTPLILIHAFPTDQRLWTPQLNLLKAHFRVIMLDLKGFGQGHQTDGQAISMTDYAKEVKQLLDQLHI